MTRDENLPEKPKKQVRVEGSDVGKRPLAKDTSNIDVNKCEGMVIRT